MGVIVIYGDFWTDCYAMKSIAEECYPEKELIICETLPVLIRYLSRHKVSGLVLCLRPHEHVYLFYHLQPLLAGAKVLIVTDRLYYTDLFVMRYFGLTDYLQRDRLLSLIQTGRGLKDLPHACPRFWQVEPLMSREAEAPVYQRRECPEQLLQSLNQFASRYLPVGISARKYSLLVLFSTGLSGASVASRIGIKENTVSLHRQYALQRLGMSKSHVSLYRGVCLREELQRTPVILADNFFVKNQQGAVSKIN